MGDKRSHHCAIPAAFSWLVGRSVDLTNIVPAIIEVICNALFAYDLKFFDFQNASDFCFHIGKAVGKNIHSVAMGFPNAYVSEPYSKVGMTTAL